MVAAGGATVAGGQSFEASRLAVLGDVVLGAAIPTLNKSTTAEPCVARNGRTTMVVGNWFAAVSSDDGASFRFLDPFSFLPPVGLGFCCDQSILYEPTRDLFVWVLLYQSDRGGNALRVATARGADAVAQERWEHHDFVAADLGLKRRRVLDFPQMAASGSAIFLTVNVVNAHMSRFTRTAIVRLPLDDLAAGVRPNYEVFTAGNGKAFAPVQGAGSIMYWVGAAPGASKLQIYRWSDGSRPQRFARARVRRGARHLARCPGPDGRDWCGDSDDRVLGAWVARGVLGFMWNAPQDRTHPYPYVRGVRVDETTGRVLDQPEMSSTAYALQYPGVGVNDRGDVAGVVAFGGGSRVPGIAIFSWNDTASGWNVEEVVEGTSGPVENRWGDFFCVRPDDPDRSTWVMSAHVLRGGPTGEFVEPHVLSVGLAADPGLQ